VPRTHSAKIIEEHLDLRLAAGLNVEGINAEVATGQWEFQVFAKGAKRAGDEVWVARYLLERTAEKYNVWINWHCKPLGDTDWNGSGMHANFSNSVLRTCGSRETYEKICSAFQPRIKEHIAVYGADNHMRLTGKHETQSIDKFSFGVSDRAHPSVFRWLRSPTVGRAGWKIAVLLPMQIPTRLHPKSSAPSGL
jgi:glutamine synthetase